MTSPTWARWVLGLVVPMDRREDVLGDLEEVHRRRWEDHGAANAWLRTSLETCLLAGAFIHYRIRERNLQTPWITGSELRLGIRLIKKQPILAATSILALAMGISVATTGFSVMDNILNGKLPFAGGERFVRVEIQTVPDGWYASLDLERYRFSSMRRALRIWVPRAVDSSIFCTNLGKSSRFRERGSHLLRFAFSLSPPWSAGF